VVGEADGPMAAALFRGCSDEKRKLEAAATAEGQVCHGGGLEDALLLFE
jgi:hypothetical protein